MCKTGVNSFEITHENSLDRTEVFDSYNCNHFTHMPFSGAGSALFSHQLCTSGNKFDTFSICSSNLPDYKINSSQRILFIFKMATMLFKMAAEFDNISTNKSTPGSNFTYLAP